MPKPNAARALMMEERDSLGVWRWSAQRPQWTRPSGAAAPAPEMPRAPVRPWPRLSAKERERDSFADEFAPAATPRWRIAGARAGRPAAAEAAEEGREEEEEDRRRDEAERAGNKGEHRRLLPLRRAGRAPAGGAPRRAATRAQRHTVVRAPRVRKRGPGSVRAVVCR